MSLLHRLLLLVLVALLPMGAMEAYNQRQLWEFRQSEIRQQALNLAMLIDAEQQQIVEGIRHVLVLATQVPVVRGGDFAGCQEALSNAKRSLAEYLDVQITDADAIVRCTTSPSSLGIGIADRPYIRQAMQTGGFVVGEHTLGRLTGRPVLPFALRYDGPKERPAGTVVGYLGLSWLSDYLRRHRLPEGTAVLVADRNGTVLARHPEVPGLVGSTLPERYRTMLHAPGPGTKELTAVDGTDRIFAFVPVGQGVQGLFVGVGLERDTATAPVQAAAVRLAVLGILVVAGGLVLVWWGAWRYIAVPVAALSAAALRWQRGDRTARVALEGHRTDMTVLGRAFNAMADSLETEETVRQAAEAALRRNEARLQSIVDTAVDAFVVIDVSGTVQSFNPAAERLFGYTAEEVVGQNVKILMPDSDRSRHDGYIANYLRTGERKVIGIGREVLGRRKDGSTFPLELAIAEWVVEGKRHFTGIMRDITLRKETEDSLRRAKEEAERATLIKSKFLAAASHDLRQPLQSLFLHMELLRARMGSNGGAEPLARIQQSLDILKALLDRLLDVSRLDAGTVQPLIRPVAITDVMAELDAWYAAAAAAKTLDWRVNGCSGAVYTDPDLLRQMLHNLVDNAIKYTDRGGVRVECRAAEKQVWIDVHDTGIGIPPDHIEQVFEEFHQVGNPERDREKGLGLGLAIVRRLSGMLDHPVEVRSEPGKGTLVRVKVPLATEVSNDNGEESRGSLAPCRPERFAVVVDDEAIVLMGLEALLRSWGYDVLAAPSAEAAVEGLREIDRCPDIIVSDYRLREGKVGTDAVQAIRSAVGADVPALLVTGETGGAVLHDAAALRLPVLHKPVPPSTLRQELERQLPAG